MFVISNTTPRTSPHARLRVTDTQRALDIAAAILPAQEPTPAASVFPFDDLPLFGDGLYFDEDLDAFFDQPPPPPPPWQRGDRVTATWRTARGKRTRLPATIDSYDAATHSVLLTWHHAARPGEQRVQDADDIELLLADGEDRGKPQQRRARQH